jgi:crossover junction endodeoxyribonuclease RuvC
MPAKSETIVVGIDPGTATTGYGVLKIALKRKSISYLDCGLIETTPKLAFPQRLEKISRDFRQLIKKHQPSLVAIESVFFFRNLKTFIPVSRASGVIILETAKMKIPLVEFTPLQVKCRVADYGRAEKKDVQKRIKQTLNLKELPKQDDVADALGIALCGALSILNQAKS